MIYYKRPETKAIIAAQPLYVMPFTLTASTIDPKLMPESYVLLGKLPTAPYGLNYQNPQKIVDMLGPDNPAILLENDGIIVTGSSLIEAFDRFEVAEFTARAQLTVPDQSMLHTLSPAQIDELDQYFMKG